MPHSRAIGSAFVPVFDYVRHIDVTLDCHLTTTTGISMLVRSADFELCRISSIRHPLSTDATKILVSAAAAADDDDDDDADDDDDDDDDACLLYTSPSPRDISGSRMPSSA